MNDIVKTVATLYKKKLPITRHLNSVVLLYIIHNKPKVRHLILMINKFESSKYPSSQVCLEKKLSERFQENVDKHNERN